MLNDLENCKLPRQIWKVRFCRVRKGGTEALRSRDSNRLQVESVIKVSVNHKNQSLAFYAYLCELNFAVRFEQNPPNWHPNNVGSQSRPRFVINFIKQSQWIVSVRHVIVGVCDDTGSQPSGAHEDNSSSSSELEVSDGDDQDNWSNDIELSVVGKIPTPEHAHVLDGE